MTVRSILSLAAAVSLGLASTTYAQARKSAPVNANQQLANNVAAHIGKTGAAAGSKVSVSALSGVIKLTGDVRSLQQAEAMVQLAYSYPGVTKVETSLRLIPGHGVQPAQAAEPIMPPLTGGGVQGFPTGPLDPLPLVQPAMPAYDMTGPKMPPYAWPTYAPYPNFSRVAYPEAYPYNAFPFIGPYYPFPKVPLGWRSVKLEWEDGHWYLGRLSTPHDYWRVKFW